MKYALSLPPFAALHDPHVLVEVAVLAESHGWDGIFLWDHLLRPLEQTNVISDPWVMLAAIAAATDRVRLGPMVTPLPRRRPLKLAREAATLDLLSRGRVTLGLGLGVDSGGELTRTDEEIDPKVRGAMLTEGIDVLDRLLRGEHVEHRGGHYVVDGITLEPTGAQSPRIPFWLATRGAATAPLRRAARFEGLCPTVIGAERLGEIVAFIRELRGDLDGFDVAVMNTPDVPLGDYMRRGATWAIFETQPSFTLDDVISVVTTTLP